MLLSADEYAGWPSPNDFVYESVVRTEPNPDAARVLLLLGPPRVGRRTVKKALLQKFPDVFGATIGSTTRSPGEGESDGNPYHFLSKAEFDAAAKNGQFVEHGEFRGNYYGTR